jgi:hypothetical protein
MISLGTNETLSLTDLGAYKEPVQICDAGGKVLGVYVPSVSPVRQKERTPDEEVAFWAEIERRAADPRPGVPLHEVYEQLLTLTDDEQLKADLRQKIDILTERDRCHTA